MEPKVELKNECKKLKCKIVSTGNPFPIHIQCSVDQPPEAEAYDIYKLEFDFIVNDFDYNSTIQFKDLPLQLRNRIGEMVLNYKSTLGKGWHLVSTCEFIAQNYVKLVSSVPQCLDIYLGDDSSGATIRRFALKEDHESEEEDEEEEEEGVEDDEEAREYWLQQRLAAAREAELEKAREGELRRQEYENDPNLHQKQQQISKKEAEEQRKLKNKQGVRMRKTGPKRKKYIPNDEKEGK